MDGKLMFELIQCLTKIILVENNKLTKARFSKEGKFIIRLQGCLSKLKGRVQVTLFLDLEPSLERPLGHLTACSSKEDPLFLWRHMNSLISASLCTSVLFFSTGRLFLFLCTHDHLTREPFTSLLKWTSQTNESIKISNPNS